MDKLKIFLSSTFRDLTAERSEAIWTINRMQEVCIAMESFGSAPQSPIELCRQRVRRSDIFVLLLASTYGYVPEGEEISMTEIEYREARAAEKPILVYVAEVDAETGSANEPRLVAFKSAVQRDHVISWFRSKDDLGSKLAADLYREARKLSADPVAAEREPELLRRHRLVLEALLSGRFEEAIRLNEEIFRFHSGRSPRALYNQACALSMLAESETDQTRQKELIDQAQSFLLRSVEQGIIRLIRLHHDEGSDPHRVIRENRGLRQLFVSRAFLADLIAGETRDGRISLGAGCVDGSMPVVRPGGTQTRLGDLRVGDAVLAKDLEDGRVIASSVRKVSRLVSHHLLIVNGTLRLTALHPIATERGWRRATELRLGDRLRSLDGTSTVVDSLERVEGRFAVIDLNVDAPHTFAVNGVLIHNKS